MRIAIVGANGQVGAEVALLMARQAPRIETRAISRTRNGSAFLRYSGLPVAHGEISDPAQAFRLLAGADVIANFALAIGAPATSIAENERIIRRVFESTPTGATIVFFSTIAVYDRDDGSKVVRSPYENSKLKAEKLAQRLAAVAGRKLYILRLGHVAGDLQGVTLVWRDEVRNLPIRIPDPDRASNVTFTVAIAEALLAIAEGRAGPPGLYDLVNTPQWTWREIYAFEAERVGKGVAFEKLDPVARDSRPSVLARAKTSLRRFALQPKVRQGLERGLALLPVGANEKAKARYNIDRARVEIAALTPSLVVRNPAALWKGLALTPLPGVRATKDLIALPEFRLKETVGPRWPADPD